MSSKRNFHIDTVINKYTEQSERAKKEFDRLKDSPYLVDLVEREEWDMKRNMYDTFVKDLMLVTLTFWSIR
jgi:hypothetical protein